MVSLTAVEFTSIDPFANIGLDGRLASTRCSYRVIALFWRNAALFCGPFDHVALRRLPMVGMGDGCDPPCLQWQLREMMAAKGKKPWTPGEEGELRRLYAERRDLDEIATQIGRSREAIEQRVRLLGLKPIGTWHWRSTPRPGQRRFSHQDNRVEKELARMATGPLGAYGLSTATKRSARSIRDNRMHMAEDDLWDLDRRLFQERGAAFVEMVCRSAESARSEGNEAQAEELAEQCKRLRLIELSDAELQSAFRGNDAHSDEHDPDMILREVLARGLEP